MYMRSISISTLVTKALTSEFTLSRRRDFSARCSRWQQCLDASCLSFYLAKPSA